MPWNKVPGTNIRTNDVYDECNVSLAPYSRGVTNDRDFIHCGDGVTLVALCTESADDYHLAQAS